MEIVFLIVLIVFLLALVCSLVRAGLGPTWFDRILALNTFTSQTILLLAVYFYATGHPEYIDIALLYGLIGYSGSLALAKFFEESGNEAQKPSSQGIEKGVEE